MAFQQGVNCHDSQNLRSMYNKKILCVTDHMLVIGPITLDLNILL
jgi:hypothetical protein